ncbi:MAG TPA: cellulase family glycosylhydrolase [Candidatus Sulfotelmatobacter sp.]
MSHFVKLAVLSLMAAIGVQAQVQPTFFSMGVATTGDMPKVSYGTISHPPIAWISIEGAGRGQYNFRSMDAFVKKAPKDANGAALLVLDLGGWTPGWSVVDQTTCFHNKIGYVACTIPPDNIQDWIDYVTQVVAHYNGKTAPHVKYYEIWNEMSNTKFWTGGVSPLLAMAQAAYPILKNDPYATVFTPSVTWHNGINFMTEYLQGGGYQYADALSFHGYPSKTGGGAPLPVPLPESPLSTNAPIATMVTTFRQLADQNGMLGKPLVTTEGGWGTNGVSDPDMQAAWIAHYELLQAGLASGNKVLFQTWYLWGQAFSGTIEDSLGNPTQAGLAYNQVYTWLVGQMPAPCSASGNIYSCVVATHMAVWDTSQSCSNGTCTTANYTAPTGYRHYLDLTGTLHTVSGPIALGVKPILLEP